MTLNAERSTERCYVSVAILIVMLNVVVVSVIMVNVAAPQKLNLICFLNALRPDVINLFSCSMPVSLSLLDTSSLFWYLWVRVEPMLVFHSLSFASPVQNDCGGIIWQQQLMKFAAQKFKFSPKRFYDIGPQSKTSFVVDASWTWMEIEESEQK